MNLGLKKEEAMYLYDIIITHCKLIGINNLKNLYGNIDIEGILRQLQFIIELGDSIDEDKDLLDFL